MNHKKFLFLFLLLILQGCGKTAFPTPAEITLEYTYKIPTKEMYVDVPSFYEVERGYTEVFINFEENLVGITTPLTENENDVSKAHETTFKMFCDNCRKYCDITSVDVLFHNNETINGMDVYYYEGYAKSYECEQTYIIGYSFVYAGMPCNITGLVFDSKQTDEKKTEIKGIVMTMMESVRNEL